MILLGLLLILLAAGLAVWLVLGSQSLHAPVNLHTPGFTIGMTPLAMLVAGAVILLAFLLGLALIRASVRRRRRVVRESKEEQRRAELEENIRADERARAEETHRSAMAERDRVRDEEFESQLSERDRLRDEDERARLAEAEERARADERARVEEEFRQRSAAGSSAGLAGAAETGSFAGAGAGSAVDDAPRHRAPDATPDATPHVAADVARGEEGQAPAAAGAGVGAAETTRFAHPDSMSGAPEGATPTEGHLGEPASEGEETAHTGGFRTVADKIMGRPGPEDQA